MIPRLLIFVFFAGLLIYWRDGCAKPLLRKDIPYEKYCQVAAEWNVGKYIKSKNDDSCKTSADCVFVDVGAGLNANRDSILKNYSCFKVLRRDEYFFCKDDLLKSSTIYGDTLPPGPGKYDCIKNKCIPNVSGGRRKWEAETSEITKKARTEADCPVAPKEIFTNALPEKMEETLFNPSRFGAEQSDCAFRSRLNAVRYIASKNDDSCDKPSDCTFLNLGESPYSNSQKVMKNLDCMNKVHNESYAACSPSSHKSFGTIHLFNRYKTPSSFECKNSRCSPVFKGSARDWQQEKKELLKRAELEQACKENPREILNRALPLKLK